MSIKKTTARAKRLTTQPTATSVEKLAVRCVREYEPIIRKDATEHNISLPLADFDVNALFDNTINSLLVQGLLPWWGIRYDFRQLFTETWIDEMNRRGLRK
jgi:hypothetical protein